MALERKDLRIKLDPDDHAGLTLVAEEDQCDLAEWAERILVRAIRRRVHNAILMAEKAKRAGIVGRPIPDDE